MTSIRKNTVWAALSNGLVFLLGLLSQIVIGRELGPAVLGEYYLMITTNLIVTNLLSLGVGLSNMTFAAKNEYPVSQLNATSLLCAFSLGALGMLLPGITELVGLNIFGDLKKSHFLVPFIILPLTIYALYWNYLMIGLNKIVTQSKLMIFISFLWFTMNITAVYMGFGMKGLILSWIIYAVVGSVLMFYLAVIQDRSRMRLNRTLLRSSVSFGVRGNLGEIATQIWKRLNIFILNYFHGVNAVGIFSVASEINDKLLLFAGPIRNAVTSRIASGTKESGGDLTARTTRHVVFWLFIIVLSLFVTSDLLISKLYGETFSGAVTPMRILLIGTLVIGSAPIIGIFFVGQLKRPGLLSMLAIFSAGVSVALGLALIPRFGIYGISIGFTITCIIGMGVLIYFFRKFAKCSLKDIFIITKDDLNEYWKSVNFWRQL